MRRARRSLAALSTGFALLLAAVFVPVARAEDEEATKVREALVAAATAKDVSRVSGVLVTARALVGPGKTFPSNADLAGWLGELPAAVTSMDVVRVERAWLYVTGKDGKGAITLLEPLLAADRKSALLRAYLGEARRLEGDAAGAVREYVQAVKDGATEEQVRTAISASLVNALREERATDPADAPPRYATVLAPLLALRPYFEVSLQIVEWLAYDTTQWKADPKRLAIVRTEWVRQALALATGNVPDEARARVARAVYEAGLARATVKGGDDMPALFDLYAAAVRMGESGNEVPAVPEALTALADEAAAKGRYVLAARLCRRRLLISDSPAARRILLTLPPDVE